MIHVCEPLCWGFEHVPFNSATLEIIRLSFPEEAISFSGQGDHLDQVREQLGSSLSESIKWKGIPIPERHSEFTSRLNLDFLLTKRLLRKSKDPEPFFVFLSITPTILISLKMLLPAFYRDLKIQLFLHGGLASLNGPHSRNPLVKVRHIKFALSLPPNRNIQYVVMEEPIKRGLLIRIPAIAGNVTVLDHPVPPGEGSPASLDFAPPFRFGFLGLASEAKGFSTFVRTAQIIEEKFPGEAEFHAIGTLDKEFPQLGSEGASLTTTPSLVPLTRRDFKNQVQNLHYICLPYSREHYDLSASGVLLDAIAWEKPLIAIRTSVLERLFSQHGPLGYLCSSREDFSDTIASLLVQKNAAEYEKRVCALKRAKTARSPEFLVYDYRKCCERIRKFHDLG